MARWNAKAFPRIMQVIRGKGGSPVVSSRGSQFGICKVCGVSSFISAAVPPGTSAQCLFKAIPTPRNKFSSVSTKRFPSALSYFLAINPSSPFPRPARPSPSWAADREVEAFCIFHLFLGSRAPGGWARPGFVLPELQGRWPVARKLKLTVKNTRVAPSTGRRTAAAQETPKRTILRYYVAEEKSDYSCMVVINAG